MQPVCMVEDGGFQSLNVLETKYHLSQQTIMQILPSGYSEAEIVKKEIAAVSHAPLTSDLWASRQLKAT